MGLRSIRLIFLLSMLDHESVRAVTAQQLINQFYAKCCLPGAQPTDMMQKMLLMLDAAAFFA